MQENEDLGGGHGIGNQVIMTCREMRKPGHWQPGGNDVQGNEDLREATALAGAGRSGSVDASTANLQAVQVVPDVSSGDESSVGRSQPWTTPHDLLVRAICAHRHN